MSASYSRSGSSGRALTCWLLAGLLSLLGMSASSAAPHMLWRLDPVPGAALHKVLRPGVHPIEFDPQALANWPAGEPGELALPGGRLYQIKADRIEEHSSGNRSWVGKFEVEGARYVAVLTYGPAGLVGEARTPDGPMVLTVDDSQIVLIDTREAGWRAPDVLESDAMAPPPLAAAATGLAPPGELIELKSAPSPQTTIDVLVAYTHAAVTRAGSTAGALLRVDQLIASTNQAYIDSEVAIRLRLVLASEVSYTETNDNGTALDDMTYGVGVLGPVHSTLRDRYGADLVVLVRPFNFPAQASCGIAWVGGYGGSGAAIGSQSSYGFAVVSDGSDVNNSGYYCQNATFAHELGHNMGAMHDRQTVVGQEGVLSVGAYAYSYGYVHNATWSAGQGQNVCNAGSGASCFGTIMSYLNIVSLLTFSNPGLSTCPTGVACGTASDNVALTLNNTRAGVAGWRATKVPFTGVQAGSGQSAALSSPFAQPLKVTIRDAAGQLVPGVTVAFSRPLSGASATLSAASVVTDANGVAQVTATANGTAGAYAVVATAATGLVASPFSFNLSNGLSAMLSVAINGSGSGSVAGGGIICPATCTIVPPAGTVVVLTASAGGGAVFTGWLGSGCSGVAACTVTVDAAKAVQATFAPAGTLPAKIDIDLNGKVDALADGLVILRYLSGMTGPSLMSGATGSGATRVDPAAVLTFLNNIAPQLDVDGNGNADPSTDGVMIIRYLVGLRGTALTLGAVGAGATRPAAAQIESYIAGLLP